MIWHRRLTPGDLVLARWQIDQHQPMLWRGAAICSSATHLIQTQLWPCHVVRWAQEVLAAEERGEVAGGGTTEARRISA